MIIDESKWRPLNRVAESDEFPETPFIMRLIYFLHHNPFCLGTDASLLVSRRLPIPPRQELKEPLKKPLRRKPEQVLKISLFSSLGASTLKVLLPAISRRKFPYRVILAN